MQMNELMIIHCFTILISILYRKKHKNSTLQGSSLPHKSMYVRMCACVCVCVCVCVCGGGGGGACKDLHPGTILCF